MSESGVSSNREVAYRLFAAEGNDASYSYSESDEERAPNYVVTPTGARVNRLFVVGVLTEVSQAGESMLRARVADPTGAFVVYAGQYQPDAMAFLDGMEPPAFVAVTGKARTFQPDDSDVVYTSIRPEEINEVDSNTRDRWTVSTAERTLERVAAIAAALDTGQTGDELRETLHESEIDPSLAAGIPIAIEHYDTTAAYLEDVQRIALDATRLVAGEIDTVDSLALAPDKGTETGTIEPVKGDEISIETPARVKSRTETDDTPEQTASTVSESVDEEPAAASPTTTTTAQREQTGNSTGEGEEEGESPTETESTPENEVEAEASDSEEFDPEEFDPEEFELDEEVRQEIEAEYGTEFSTAAEVDAPGEAGIETDESDTEPASTQETEPTFEDRSEDVDTDEETTTETASTIDTTTEPEPEPETESEPESEIETETEDIESLLLDQMGALDDGDGADRETLIERVRERAGVSAEVVEDTIQDALMSGKCYEPDGETLKPI